MDDLEKKPAQDDFDIEIMPIDAEASTIQHASFKPRFTRRQRAIQLVVTAGIMCAILLALVFNTASIRGLVVGTFVRSTPTPTLALDVHLFYVDASPSWGHLFVDGKLVAHLPTLLDGPPLELTPGHHTLQWKAEPFISQSCTVSVPPRYRLDSCHYDEIVFANDLLPAWFFHFSASLERLSSAQRQALIDATQFALDTQAPMETVLPGEAYAIGQQIIIATQPLKATRHFLLDTDTTQNTQCSTMIESSGRALCYSQLQDCRGFCSTSEFISPAVATSNQEWDVMVVAHPVWDYAMLDGTVVAGNQPDTTPRAAQYDHFVPLRITWDGMHWHVTILFAKLNNDGKRFLNSPCISANDALETMPSLGYIASEHMGTNWSFSAGANPATGCLGTVTLAPNSYATPSPLEHTVAYCLYRFGVFVAVNNIAHRFWPTIPVADNYEKSLVQQFPVQA